MYDEQFRATRRKIVGRFVLRLTFLFNLLFFALVLLQITRDVTSDRLMGTAFFVLIWGSFLLIHAAFAFNIFGGLIDRAARHELERESPADEKPKHQEMVLGEDGELIEIAADELPDEKAKRLANG